MTYLLDTHALIWFLENDPQLPQTTRNQIETTPTIFVSIVSLWEIAIKTNIAKLTLSVPFNAIEANLIALGITQLPIAFADLEIYLSLPLHHRDPFDRLLIAQAINYSLTLISQDTPMDAYLIQRFWK
ncbi:MAG: type II toxin-antitoxin system VapC family toxin [Microcystis sp.]|jgi:PIN domain nuclease of toxin-antitoxin system|uniref:PilT protein domain protein n=2 Tax=Microcystis aeruginosa TaxID=1126 RepID=I4GYK4_MICAE|nr:MULTISPECIES: type II toxin-antitoxin system VapC family toxin [Microcystis]MBE5229607.1 type II toxin-antitoxin system VapC family toxin [Microcystis aeruginosa PMC 728.11]MCA2540385.1 type II toxin-antitoxin system VapC family toxin [Microcystis sp. M54BS1]MCA2598458.1 type II toxin-antitoxin system VapC family toxin [Microcystis sp. M38BS1]MCA2610938.1 type II toxin-antitoxin system VapC family toxin [Microcystis sp. M27BS1]MDY7049252.1 type II toxin-antitoxin system VapC family toxin [M